MPYATHTLYIGWRAYKTFQPAVHPVAGHCCYLFGVCLVEWVRLGPNTKLLLNNASLALIKI